MGLAAHHLQRRPDKKRSKQLVSTGFPQLVLRKGLRILGERTAGSQLKRRHVQAGQLFCVAVSDLMLHGIREPGRLARAVLSTACQRASSSPDKHRSQDADGQAPRGGFRHTNGNTPWINTSNIDVMQAAAV